jgi:peptidoglycan/LPS O-acetylase OafA/YrhL
VLAVSLLLVAVTAGPRSAFTRVLGTTPLVAVGRWSYGIYLWHLPVTIILVENIAVPGGPLGFVQWIGLILGVSAALGAFTYTFIEKPAIAWSKR